MNDVNPAAITGAQSRQLVEHLAHLTLSGLGTSVVRDARIRLIDGLGCGLYGAKMPWGKIITEFAYAEKSQGNATVFGRHEPIAAARAALCNGTAMHGIELDDVETGGQLHPGSVVIPAALAAAQHCGAPGERLLLGVVAGYEAISRVGKAISEIALSFHMTGIAGPAGATVAAGVTMNLSTEQILRAIGIACSCAAGIKSFTQGSGGMIKRMHAGRAAEAGVMACLLAERGFTAPLAALDGQFGLLEAFGADKAEPARLVENLGQDYIVSHIWTKVYPCCGYLHSGAQALESLRAEHNIKPSTIEKIRIGIQHRATVFNCAISPKETMAAQYSMPFVAAVALASDPKDPRSFEGSALNNPEVCDLAQRVELHADPEIQAMLPHFSTRVEVHLKNGSKLEASLRDAHGTVDDPCSEDQVKAKFRRLAAGSIGSGAIESVLNVIERIEQLPSIAPLSAAMFDGK